MKWNWESKNNGVLNIINVHDSIALRYLRSCCVRNSETGAWLSFQFPLVLFLREEVRIISFWIFNQTSHLYIEPIIYN